MYYQKMLRITIILAFLFLPPSKYLLKIYHVLITVIGGKQGRNIPIFSELSERKAVKQVTPTKGDEHYDRLDTGNYVNISE